MYGNYTEPSHTIGGRQEARQLNDLARALSELAKEDMYDGDSVVFGYCAAAYIDHRYGMEAVAEMLNDRIFLDEIYDLVIQLDKCGEFDEPKADLQKFLNILEKMSTEEIKELSKKVGMDQVDIDHLLIALGRDENE